MTEPITQIFSLMDKADKQKTLSLAWDSRDCRSECYGIEIFVAPLTFPPFKVEAMVEEQDSCLLMGEQYRTETVSDTLEPAWSLANRLEQSPEHTPGSVLICRGRPLRLQAIVHDVHQSPTWQEAWIRQALSELLSITQERNISRLALPILGSQFGQHPAQAFLAMLAECLGKLDNNSLKQIWIMNREGQSCRDLLSFLSCREV